MSKYMCTKGTPPNSYRVRNDYVDHCFLSSTIHDRRHYTNEKVTELSSNVQSTGFGGHRVASEV